MAPDAFPASPDAKLRRVGMAARIMFTLGLLACAVAGYLYMHQREFLAHATHVQGTIQGSAESHSRKYGDYYTAVFSFTDAAGQVHTATDRSSHESRREPVAGEPCQVLYNPERPDEAQLEEPDTFLETLGPGFIFLLPGGTVMLVSILAFYLQRWAVLQHARAAAADPDARPEQ